MYNFKQFINESVSNTITLYHGTCVENAKRLVENGWKPNSGSVGGNLGQSKYLYLSSDYEDALWFAEEKGCNSVVQINDVPLDYLIPDPEDESGYTMSELLDRLNRSKIPSKFALTTSLPSSYFTIK